MSYVVRRGISTLIPPKAIGAAKDAARMERVGNFYGKLPRGRAPEVKPSGFFARYHAKHFGKNPTAKPLVHLIVAMTLLGYSIQYVTHLRMSFLSHKPLAHPFTKYLQVTTRTMPTEFSMFSIRDEW
ncbi:conserved hypothetical protein [Uncinocarpus reesii 1704]|uniref:Mitochondrial F1F0 ATP synthase subunit F n=1 Tax=Uncinocarpus reesii (strain UAMH 1704) TaxID=336963 RepID=C4JDM1_UNCRE|nr:uncharacterized protein UREG_00730 [Uncinocarpus reesii 1704]EEP75883.1 conserved hypothetical protein [Uncinocarpus reesii 1704]